MAITLEIERNLRIELREDSLQVLEYLNPVLSFIGLWVKIAQFSNEDSWNKSAFAKKVTEEHDRLLLKDYWDKAPRDIFVNSAPSLLDQVLRDSQVQNYFIAKHLKLVIEGRSITILKNRKHNPFLFFRSPRWEEVDRYLDEKSWHESMYSQLIKDPEIRSRIEWHWHLVKSSQS